MVLRALRVVWNNLKKYVQGFILSDVAWMQRSGIGDFEIVLFLEFHCIPFELQTGGTV
jgi:hypothetical protein